MDKPRPCGCKGCRTCLICEKEFSIDTKDVKLNKQNGTYVYCPKCDCAWPGWDVNCWKTHPNHIGTPLQYSGVYIELDFLTETEERKILDGMDSLPWDLSQSGRRKQNYGPKCNFKKRKLRLGQFEGFPHFSQFVQEKFKEVRVLKGFQTIEQCSLEYDPKRGASIDPHIDDCWIWGERIVTVNLLSDSVLTMTFNQKTDKYNLDCVKTYGAILTSAGNVNINQNCYKLNTNVSDSKPIIRIPMPKRSLLVLHNSARYDWEHQVLRDDIKERRVCIAYREFTPPYLSLGNKASEGKAILEKACQFW